MSSPKPSTQSPVPALPLRDQFAMAALSSLRANDYTSARWSDEIAITAYRIADAMLRARSQSTPQLGH